MWDEFVSALFTTFCEVAFVPAAPGPALCLQGGGLGRGWAGYLLNLASQHPPSVGAIPQLNVTLLSLGSLLRVVLTADPTGAIAGPGQNHSIVQDAHNELNRHITLLGSRQTTTRLRLDQVGIRKRTDDLVAAHIHFTGLSSVAAEQTQRLLQELHSPPLRLFLELFFRRTPLDAAYLAEMWIQMALHGQPWDHRCDDVFQVRCFEPVLGYSVTSGNVPPKGPLPQAFHSLTALGQRLVDLFDGYARHIPSPFGGGPDPYGRLMLYLSYFGRLNAVLIAHLLRRPTPEVVSVLKDLWRNVLDVL